MRQGTPSAPRCVRLVVGDVGLSRRFYTEVLGMSPTESVDGDGWSCSFPDGRRLVVQRSDGRRRNSSQSAFTVELPTSDAVIASHILARIAGGASCPPVRIAGRWTASLIDPDGHVIRAIVMNRPSGRAAGAPQARVSRRGHREPDRFRPRTAG